MLAPRANFPLALWSQYRPEAILYSSEWSRAVLLVSLLSLQRALSNV